jgi:predicted transglutaminase-like cysteine proteinase
MKRIILIIVLLITLSSCADLAMIEWQTKADKYDFDNFVFTGHIDLLPNTNENTVKNLTIISDWILNNITYVHDIDNYKTKDFWANPDWVLKTRKGDCEDMAGLMAAMSYKLIGVKMNCLYVTEHCVAEYNGVCYDQAKHFVDNIEHPTQQWSMIEKESDYLKNTNVELIKIIPFENIPQAMFDKNQANDEPIY